MQLDLLTLTLIVGGVVVAVLLAVVAGALSARLLFQASGLDQADSARRGKDS